jgi:hypothetical protein
VGNGLGARPARANESRNFDGVGARFGFTRVATLG